MAYLSMTQDIIKFMNSSFDKENITSYQMLLVLFSKLFADEEEFLKDRGDRMGLSHYVENFLRKNDFQTIVTIKDLNMVFNNNKPYDITDKELYKVFFVLIYEELSSNDPHISFKIKEAIFTLINQLQEMVGNTPVEVKNTQADIPMETNVNTFTSPTTSNNITPTLTPTPTQNRDSKEEINSLEQMSKPMEDFRPPMENMGIDFNPMPPQPIDKLPKNGPSLYPGLESKNELENRETSFVIHNKKYLREFIQKKKLLPYQCAICGLSEWQNEPLRLELDSFSGVYSNTNLHELRFLCPNCYSQIGHVE